jgi:TRAP transporter TAXI family solute receptor
VKRAAWILILILTITLVAPLIEGCRGKTVLTLATGFAGGTYYPIGEDLARLLNEHNSTGMQIVQRETAGSIQNIQLLEKGEVQTAFVQSNIAHFAATGREMFKSPVKNLAGICSLFPEAVHIITVPGTGISEVEDLRNRTVSVGPASSGTEFDAVRVLGAAGLLGDGGKAKVKVLRLGFEESLDQLQDGLVDAIFLTGGYPIKALAALKDFTLIPLDKALADRLVKENQYFTKWTIPPYTYANAQQQVDTVAVMALWVVERSVPESMVYDLVRTLWEFKKGAFLMGFFDSTHTREADIQLQTALTKMSIPLHPGAARYYREKGLPVNN